jgi:biotin carboxyl carrier protein
MKHVWKLGEEVIKTQAGAKVSWENERFFKVFFQGKTYFGEIESCDTELNHMRVKINHRSFDVTRELPIHQLLKSMGLDKIAPKKLDIVQAPMPGKVLGIQVHVGDEVVLGQSLLTLEAMKMENVIKAEGIGKVKSIEVSTGNTVDKGAVLIRFE